MCVKGRSNRLIPICLLGKIGKFQERLIFMLLWHNQTPSIYSYQLDIFSTILDLILVNIWACKQKVECSIQFTPMWIPVIFPHKTSIMLGKNWDIWPPAIFLWSIDSSLLSAINNIIHPWCSSLIQTIMGQTRTKHL